MAIKKIYPDGFKVYGPPYSKVELLDIYKTLNSAPVTVMSDRFDPQKKAQHFSKASAAQKSRQQQPEE